jgi:hypothetical protein
VHDTPGMLSTADEGVDDIPVMISTDAFLTTGSHHIIYHKFKVVTLRSDPTNSSGENCVILITQL